MFLEFLIFRWDSELGDFWSCGGLPNLILGSFLELSIILKKKTSSLLGTKDLILHYYIVGSLSFSQCFQPD